MTRFAKKDSAFGPEKWSKGTPLYGREYGERARQVRLRSVIREVIGFQLTRRSRSSTSSSVLSRSFSSMKCIKLRSVVSNRSRKCVELA